MSLYAFTFLFTCFASYIATMSSKYCSSCTQKRPLLSFLKDTLASPNSRVFATCISCRTVKKKSDKKRAALQSLDPNIQPAKRARRSNTGLQPTIPAPLPQIPPVELPPLPPNPLAETLPPQAPVTALPLPEPTGFLPTNEWQRIQDFNRAMEAIQMETCQRCREHGFSMDLKDGVCHRCFLRDTDNQKRPVTPFLMSAENDMDPGIVPADLPELTQVEEMVIARAHVQMLVKRVRGHQYHYTGHCVTFMQNIVRTVDVLPSLPSELDIILLQPPANHADDLRYRRQFQADFRVRRQHILTWLYFLKTNHPGYRYITISTDRIAALPVDGDVSLSVIHITDDTLGLDGPIELADAPPTSQSVVFSLDQDTTEANLILEEITGRRPPPRGLPAPSIQHTPIDEASGREQILSLAFPTLYPTGQADLNTPRLRNVPLKDYARHLLCWHDMRFAQHARWRFFIFNMYMRQKARSTAQFYVSRTSNIKDLTREELMEALNTDANLLPQIVRQGALLPGTRPYWRNRGGSLQAHARFLSPSAAPVFLTLSCADMQWHDLQRHLPRFTDYLTGDDRTRQRIVWSNVQDYPHLVAHYLDIRFRAFLKHVLRPYLGITDHWIRYEWQHRGSGHLHCLFWTESSPPLDPLTDEQRATFAEYWGQRITAWNPDQLRHPDTRNPASLAPLDVTNTSDQFAAFLNRLQLHSACRPSYCLVTNKKGETSCRFFYPRPLAQQPVVTKEINHRDYMFAPARNQAILNQCSPVVTMGWMANTDIQPSLSLHAVLAYLAKYVSKPEKSSVSYTELQVCP
jgi:ATP-dependent DNA helicase PIF1